MDNSRLFLFAATAFVGMLLWQQWQADYGPQPVVVEQPGIDGQVANGGEVNAGIDDLPELAENQLDAGRTATDSNSITETQKNGQRLILIETDVIRAEIDSLGGVVRSLKLKKFPVTLDQPDVWLEIVHSQSDSVYLMQSGLRNKNNTAPTHYSIYQTARTEYRLEDGEDELIVPFYWSENGIEVTKSYHFRRGDYLVDVKHRVVNNSGDDWIGSQYRQIQRSRPLETSRLLYTYTGSVYYNEEVKYEKVDFDDMEDSVLKTESTGGWIAMLQHYFLSAWVPTEDDKNLVYSIANTKRNPATYTIGLRSENNQASPGGSVEFNSQMFVGPKIVDRLEEISPGLDLTVDYGVLTFISKPLYW
ncbi:MAG: membrane protein insertase YidC, partial [Gammaproteobacteria bacterium]|nr:membrane protein insertase YidC [Gammaproteobacteria bacterium]